METEKGSEMTQKVDFLGIGAQKAATSWLYHNLRQHSSIWVPPRKELHYFDRSPIYPSPSHLASARLLNRLFGTEDHNKGFINLFIRALLHGIKDKDWNQVQWTLGYFLGTYNDDWYRSLFTLGEGKVKGEVTPSYSILTVEDVRHISEMFPELKVILILRNPIERAWSHVRFDWKRLGLNGLGQLDRIKNFIDTPDQALRSDYVRTLGIWTSCFPKEQIFIGFYDDVMEDPQGVMLRVLKFLDVAPLANAETLNRKVNVSRVLEMPIEIQYYLASRYYPELQKLSNLLGGHCTVWLKEAERLLNAAEECATAGSPALP